MHPVTNLRGTASSHLAGRRIVLGISGSIAAVKTVELARELIRHGADVTAVMTDAATRIVHPDALEFATGNRPILRLTGQVEHVSLLGEVAEKADLLLIAPATANTVSKMALGIDDSPVTTCATVAFGTKTPVVVAPAMHEAMLKHPIVADHKRTLVERLGVTWVEPLREEKKAKLADVDGIVEAVIHRIATGARPGALAGKCCLVVTGSTHEAVDPIRVLTNRASGRTGHLIATELHRLGAEIVLWQGPAGLATPGHLVRHETPFKTHAELLRRVKGTDLGGFDQVWMPAAIGDFAPAAATQKIGTDDGAFDLRLRPLPKVVEAIRAKAPAALLVAFKAETDAKQLIPRAKGRLKRYGADFIVANTHESFGSDKTTAHLVSARGVQTFSGPKDVVLPQIVATVAGASLIRRMAGRGAAKATPPPKAPAGRRGPEPRPRPSDRPPRRGSDR